LRLYCEDPRPGHQLKTSRKQHKVLCKRLKAKKVVPHTILLGVGGSIYTSLSRQIYAVPDLCCILSRRLVELVGGVFDPLLSSAMAVFEHVEDELAVIPCLLLATL